MFFIFFDKEGALRTGPFPQKKHIISNDTKDRVFESL